MACEKQIVFEGDPENPDLWLTKEVDIEPEGESDNKKGKSKAKKGETKPGNGKNQRRKHRGGRRDH